MKKTFFVISLFTSICAYSQADLFVSSTDDWSFYFRPGIGGNHVWGNQVDKTLSAVVLSKGKGAKFGQEGMYSVEANCSTGELNSNDKGWKKPASGTVTDAMLKKMCTYTKK